MAISVLIVDDSAIMRGFIARALKLARLEISCVWEAANGQEALELLGREKVDLALLDLNMPIMGGMQLLMRMRETPALANLPVVIVSTEGSEERIKRTKELRAAFLRKPFAPEALVNEVVEALGA